jgi:hypothetical protein
MSFAHAVAAWSFEGCTIQASCGFERRSTGKKRQCRAFSVLNVVKDLRKCCHISPTAGHAPLGRIRSRNLSSTKWADLHHFDVSRRVLSENLVQRVYTPRSKSHIVRSGLEYEALKGVEVLEASTSQPVELLSLWKVRDTQEGRKSNETVCPAKQKLVAQTSWQMCCKSALYRAGPIAVSVTASLTAEWNADDLYSNLKCKMLA